MKSSAIFWLLLGTTLGWFGLPDTIITAPTLPSRHPHRSSVVATPTVQTQAPLDNLRVELAEWSQRMEQQPEKTMTEVSAVKFGPLRQLLRERLWTEWMQRDPQAALMWFKADLRSDLGNQERLFATGNDWIIALCSEASRGGARQSLSWIEDAQSFLPNRDRHTPFELLSLLLAEAPDELAERCLKENRFRDKLKFCNLLTTIDVKDFHLIWIESGGMHDGPFGQSEGWSQFMKENEWEDFVTKFVPRSLNTPEAHLGEYVAAEWMAYHPESAKRWIEKALTEKDPHLDTLIREFARALPPKELVAFMADTRMQWMDNTSLSYVLGRALSSYPELEDVVLNAPNNEKILACFIARSESKYWVNMRNGPEEPLLLKTPKILDEILLNHPTLVDDTVRKAQFFRLAQNGDFEGAKAWADAMEDAQERMGSFLTMGRILPQEKTKELWELVLSKPELMAAGKLSQFAEKFIPYKAPEYMNLLLSSASQNLGVERVSSVSPFETTNESLISDSFAHWIKDDPAASQAWLNTRPADKNKDVLLEVYAKHIVKEKLQLGLSLAMSVSEPEKRSQALEEAMRSYRYSRSGPNDVGEALRWIEQSNLPEAQKAELTNEVLGK